MSTIVENQVQFWRETSSGGGLRIEIINSRFIKFLENLGYRKLVKDRSFILVKIVCESIICPVEIFQIRDEVKNYLISSQNREDVWEEFLQSDFLSRRIVEGVESISLDIENSEEDKAYLYFKNGILKVTATEKELLQYENFEGYVWQDQILQRDFTEVDATEAEFKIFCEDLSKNEPDRYTSLQSILGYLLHGYKDLALTKAIILIDEVVDLEGGVSEGGTGKSLIADAISKIIPTLIKNGKNINSDNRFFFSDVEPHHKVLVFDDVKKDFQFESLYSMITGDLPVEKKYKNLTVLNFKSAPKVLITSNFVVRGTGGNSERRRKVEFEVSTYYRVEQTITEKFGHRFFDDWTEIEWRKFDNYMVECVQVFLNNGIIEPAPINLHNSRLIIETHPLFVNFLDSVLETPNDFEGTEEGEFIRFNKGNLFRSFVRASSECRGISQIRFKKWIDIYCNIKQIEVNHFKSDSNTFVKFKKSDI